MSSTSRPSIQADPGLVGQLLAGLGAVLTLLGALTIVLPAVGVALLVVGTIVSAPYAGEEGPHLRDWWTVLGVAALACLCGIGLWFAAEVLGNVLMVGGAVTALVALGLGIDLKSPRDS